LTGSFYLDHSFSAIVAQPLSSAFGLKYTNMKKVTVNAYRKDKYYPRVVRAVAKVLSKSDVVAPIEVLIEMGNLSKKNHEAWRKGQVPYLERVFEGSLSKANRILRIIGFHTHDLNMVPSDRCRVLNSELKHFLV
jgi:hypothetical protein